MVVALPAPSLTLTPLLLVTVLPVVTLPSAPRSMSLASWTLRPSVPFAITPMLPAVRLLESVSPPVMVSVSPRLRSINVPSSPWKLRPALVKPVTAVFTSPALTALFALAARVMSPALATPVS